MSFDVKKFADLMAAFESGRDLEAGPFLAFERGNQGLADLVAMMRLIEPFLEGGAVLDTERALPGTNDGTDDDHGPLSYAVAGFLQGLAIGHAYGAAKEDDDVKVDVDLRPRP
jgi:hypothetical protein